MEIDITSSDGNTLVALAHACRVLRDCGRNDEVAQLRAKVLTAPSPEAARALITQATNEVITFYDPREGE